MTAEDIFNEGMEYWWGNRRREAALWYRRALKLDPLHADAHNHLGIICLDKRRFKQAERHFRASLEGGERTLRRAGKRVPWSRLENRPYLRGMANLALTLCARKQWAEALALHEELLKLDPQDHSGVRFLVGVERLRLGDIEGAIRDTQPYASEEPTCAFGLALANIMAQQDFEAIGLPLLHGFALNRYVAPLLLGVDSQRIDGFHSTSKEDTEWANDVVDSQGDLWSRRPKALRILEFWWTAAPVVQWRKQLDHLMTQFRLTNDPAERMELSHQQRYLTSSACFRELLKAVTSVS